MSDRYFEWHDENPQRDWPYKLNRLKKLFETACRQYDITVQAMLRDIEKYRARNLPGAVKEIEDRLIEYKDWKLEEINQVRNNMYLDALASQAYLQNELGLSLPPEQKVENTALGQELKIENNQLVLLTESDREKRIQEMAKEAEEDMPGEQAYISSEMQRSVNNYIAPEDKALYDKLEADYRRWLKQQEPKA